MVDDVFVKRRKRKRIAAIAGGIGAIGVTAFVIVAFLGTKVGTFTVTLNSENVDLSLGLKKDFTKSEGTSYLYVGKINSFTCFTSSTGSGIHNDEINNAKIDNEETDYTTGVVTEKVNDTEISVLRYFKYTFYLKNTGSTHAGYRLSLDISEAAGEDVLSLSKILRIRLFENEANSNEHKSFTYARMPTNPRPVPDGGEPIYKEYLNTPKFDSPDFAFVDYSFECGNSFAKGDKIFSIENSSFGINECMRYTFLCWLEGEDLDAVGKEPTNCSIKLGINVVGYAI